MELVTEDFFEYLKRLYDAHVDEEFAKDYPDRLIREEMPYPGTLDGFIGFAQGIMATDPPEEAIQYSTGIGVKLRSGMELRFNENQPETLPQLLGGFQVMPEPVRKPIQGSMSQSASYDIMAKPKSKK